MAVAAAHLQTPTAARRGGLRLVGPAHAVATRGAVLPARSTAVRARPASPAVLRRRRLVAALVASAVVLAIVLAVVAPAWSAPSIADQVAEPAPTVVVVGDGETVWDVVAPHVPAGVDQRAYVVQVVAANEVDAGAVVPGTALRLP